MRLKSGFSPMITGFTLFGGGNIESNLPVDSSRISITDAVPCLQTMTVATLSPEKRTKNAA